MELRRSVLLTLLFTTVQLTQATDVLTQHNDPARTGANREETILTPANVNSKQFGKLFDVPVEGQIYAQPLVVTGLTIKGQTHNVVFLGTQHNVLYAIDADNGEILWQHKLGAPMPTPNVHLPAVQSNTPYHDLAPEEGITATPVIDRESGTLYFTNFEEKPESVPPGASWHHYLHAVNLADGEDRQKPTEIYACFTSDVAVKINNHQLIRGRHNVNTRQCFDPLQHMQRVALLLVKPANALPQIVLAFGSHGDYPPYHGWVMSYQANDIGKQLAVWVSNTDNTPEGSGGGIWQSGMGLALDEGNNFYLITGNGAFNHDTAFGESILRFSTANNTIAMAGYFTPCNRDVLDKSDIDLGSSGPMLLLDPSLPSNPGYLLAGGKEGVIYMIRKDHLPGRQSCLVTAGHQQDQIHMKFQAVAGDSKHSHHIHGAPVYWNSKARGPVIYVWGETDHLRAYPLVQTMTPGGLQWFINNKPAAWAVGADTSPAHPWNPNRWMMTGGMLSISSNGDHDGVIWATTPFNNDANLKAVPGILRAYDAADLRKELWNSYEDRDSDDFGNYAKFTPSTVANGKVYVPTFSNHLTVYGLRTKRAYAAPVNLLQNPSFENGTNAWTGTAGRFTAQINYPYFGTQNAMLCTNSEQGRNTLCPEETPEGMADAELSQTITAPKSGTYDLEAWCATNILPNNYWIQTKEVLLRAEVDGRPAGEPKTIQANAGFQLYKIEFQAQAGQKIRISYFAPSAVTTGGMQIKLITPDAWAVIDGVSLTAR